VLVPLRLIKDEDEIDVMRRASLLADQVLANVLPLLKAGMTEIDVLIEVHAQMERLGSKGPSFTPTFSPWVRTRYAICARPPARARFATASRFP